MQGYDPQWRKMFLVYGDNPYQQLSESTHNSDINRLFDAGESKRFEIYFLHSTYQYDSK